MKIKILSFNIHKGFNWNGQKFTLIELKKFLETENPDVVFLQEIVGENHKFREKVGNYPIENQLEFLADKVWPHFSYGKNAIYDHGHHGNAILSRFPLVFMRRQNLSLHRLEQRGLLHGIIHLDNLPIHLLCTHLNLFHFHRTKQYKMISDYIKNEVGESRIILGGDFNDWNRKASRTFEVENDLSEVFKKKYGQYAKTFPVQFPILTLDRLYVKNLECTNVKIYHDQKLISDHLPISAELVIQ